MGVVMMTIICDGIVVSEWRLYVPRLRAPTEVLTVYSNLNGFWFCFVKVHNIDDSIASAGRTEIGKLCFVWWRRQVILRIVLKKSFKVLYENSLLQLIETVHCRWSHLDRLTKLFHLLLKLGFHLLSVPLMQYHMISIQNCLWTVCTNSQFNFTATPCPSVLHFEIK